MAPLPDTILSLLPRSFFTSTRDAPTISNIDPRSLSPMAAQGLHLAKRAASTGNNYPGSGAKDPNSFNNLGYQILFAFLGVGMVVTALWFFFWAKNGGFKFENGDWEDYKSTVLRRKGPDGRTLSNATKSTKLGGGSVVHGGTYGAPTTVGYTDTETTVSEMRQVEEGHGVFGLRGGDAEKKKNKARKHTNDLRDNDLREYRGEKPAKVGGLNRQADGTYTDYSNNGSDLGSNLSSRPLVKSSEKSKDPKKQKQEAKEKERRAKERMRQAKLIEKNAARQAAVEAKAKKEADKAQAKKDKSAEKAKKKTKTAKTEVSESEPAMTEYPPTEYPQTEYPQTEADITEYAASEVPAPVFKSKPRTQSSNRQSRRESRHRAPPSAAYSFTTGDDTNTVYTGTYTDNSATNESSYYSDYRPNADPSTFSRSRAEREREREERRSRRESQSQARTQSRSRPTSQSPRKHHRTSRPAQSVADSDMFTVNGPATGTIAYPCHIPGLSSAGSVGVSESVSQVGGPSSRSKGRDVMDGYRRGGIRPVGRRDSLSDSD